MLSLVTASVDDLIRHKVGPVLKRYNIIRLDLEHLSATMDWLRRTHDVTGRRGSSKGYSLVFKWLPAFPETTGYIITTFFDYAKLSNNTEFAQRACQMADWLVQTQLPDGGCMQGLLNTSKPHSVVFNTGQMLLGLVRAYKETRKPLFMESARAAGDFLVSCIDDNGCYCKSLYNNTIHTYNVRCSWSLLQLYGITDDSRYRDCAIKNLEWTIKQQLPNGWYKSNSFRFGSLPNTHSIAYTTRGILEAYSILGEERYLEAAHNTAEKVMLLFETRGWISATHDEHWKYQSSYICLSGNIQFSIIWMRLYNMIGDARFLNSALKVIDFAKTTQKLSITNHGIRGAIKGSQPIFGRYAPMQYPNWAAKFFADSLMLKMNIMRALQNE